MKRLEIVGVNFAELTLHVGLGTFRPVEVEDLSKHKMDSEQVIIPQESVEIINNGIENKKTNLCCWNNKYTFYRELCYYTKLNDLLNGWTNKFIYPPYDFKIANSMITNFIRQNQH